MLNALKPKALFVVLATVVALAATPALADGGDRHNGGHGQKHGYKHAYKHGQKHGYKHGNWRPNYGYRPYYKPYYAYRPAYRPVYRPYGTSLNFTYLAPTRSVYQTPIYVQPVAPQPYVQQQVVTVTNPPVQNRIITASTRGSASCLMTREYQTEIVVGNRVVPGYGEACLQPDGSWLRLPASPARY